MILPGPVREQVKSNHIVVMENDSKVSVEPIDGFLGGESVSGRYGIAYDRAFAYLRDVRMRMSRTVGWRSETVPFDFEGFSGWHVETGPDRSVLYRGDVAMASFSAGADGGLVFEDLGPANAGERAFPAYPDDVNPWYPLADLMNGGLCLEPGNIALARSECHGGRELIYGTRFGDACVFCVDPEDANLRARLADLEVNIRFALADDVDRAFDSWYGRTIARGGYEPLFSPEAVLYFYDGRDVLRERDLCEEIDGLSLDRWEEDWRMLDELRREGNNVRSELEREAGVAGRRHFRFTEAVYPFTGFRDDVLFFATAGGRLSGDFMTVSAGRVGLYRTVGEGRSALRVTYPDVAAAVRAVRGVCLDRRNIGLARGDYRRYLESRGKASRREPDAARVARIKP